MEIIIGSAPPLIPKPQSSQQANAGGTIEAKLLHVRPPRRGVAGPSGMERREKKSRDPQKSKILIVMVPDGDLLPKDLESGDYKVQLRFLR